MSTSSSPTTHDGYIFLCECEGWMRSACRSEIFYKEHDGKRYCVLHYPGIEKKEDFQRALARKIGDEDFSFRGVWFTDIISFQNVTFSEDADFYKSKFSADTSFNSAQFSNAEFTEAQFSAIAHFNTAVFNGNVFFKRTNFTKKDDSLGRSANSNNKAISPDDGDGANANLIHIS